MKYLPLLLVLFARMMLAETPLAIPARQEPHHHVMFENPEARILDVQVPPGEATLMHSHDHDDSSVCISGSPMRAKTPTADWGNPGQPCTVGRGSVTQWAGTPGSHAVANAGDKLFHLVLIENLHETFQLNSTPLANETAARENRAFRVFEMQLPAANEKSHTHNKPTVVVLIHGDAQFDGKRVREDGAWTYVAPGQPHTIHTLADSQITEVELR